MSGRHLVSFTYANRPDRKVTVSAAKVFDIFRKRIRVPPGSFPLKFWSDADERVYVGWCKAVGHMTSEGGEEGEGAGPEPASVTADDAAPGPALSDEPSFTPSGSAPWICKSGTTPTIVNHGWPEGATHTQSGGWYNVTYGDVTTRVQGKTRAMEAAWRMAAGE